MAQPDLDPATEAAWRQRFADQEASDLSVRLWCVAHAVPERQFYRWRVKLLGPRRTPPAPRPTAAVPGFVPVRPVADTSAEVTLPNGLTVRLPLSCDPAHAARLVAALRSHPC